jgi:peptide deformylase
MQIINQNEPILHRPSQQLTKEQIESKEEIKTVASLLISTIYSNSALGASACQIGVDLAMFAMDTGERIRVCINPQIVAAAVNMEMQEEGCLSYPGLRLKIKRPDSVVVRYLDIDGQEVTEQLDGLEARVWLHEYDHTMGICFTDRASKLSIDMAKKRLNKIMKRSKR